MKKANKACLFFLFILILSCKNKKEVECLCPEKAQKPNEFKVFYDNADFSPADSLYIVFFKEDNLTIADSVLFDENANVFEGKTYTVFSPARNNMVIRSKKKLFEIVISDLKYRTEQTARECCGKNYMETSEILDTYKINGETSNEQPLYLKP